MTDDVGSVVAAIRDAQRITAICHESPDGDTLGAALAIALVAERGEGGTAKGGSSQARDSSFLGERDSSTLPAFHTER